LASNDSHTVKIFSQNIQKLKGVKKEHKIKVMLLQKGHMFGDYPILNNVPSQITMKCESMKGSIWKISKKDLFALKDSYSQGQDNLLDVLRSEANLF
jgi:ABC-type transporter Mla maintaining outer membrane lipid asymmetry ATPase subunit MlaF